MSLLVCASEGLAHATEPITEESSAHAPAVLWVCVRQAPVGCWQVLLLPSHSSKVQALVSAVQAVPAATFASAGQLALDPLQVSATSHTPPEARQTVPAGWMTSAGQATLVPVQLSATSHAPAA